ncbi:hypothetical protein [Paenibacillus rigui]|uniref:Phosphatase n=1 Tax=Paenibacillus rigui TaxID=554312 RepID=A0A229UL55_9BACL|nr:hypothetical protein [Paenibacillus rigui]OXM84034.1 phosphatase [Paenibacillus rigui]
MEGQHTGGSSPKLHLIVEALNDGSLPNRFRKTPVTEEELSGLPDHLNRFGFAELRMSGSAQFSHQGLQRMMKEIGETPITVVDLRQESHGFVDGLAVNWFGLHNGGNKGLTNQEVMVEEKSRLDGLRLQESVVFDRVEEKSINVEGPVAHRNAVHSEEELVVSEGLGYARFYVTDHHRPPDSEVDRFQAFLETLPEGTWLHFHCRGGVGRTTTFMLMYDMLRHSPHVSLDELLERHTATGGRDMYRLDSPDSPKYAPAVERLAFIKQFYAYCLSQADKQHRTPWSRWIAERNAREEQ